VFDDLGMVVCLSDLREKQGEMNLTMAREQIHNYF
jgi:hypothetical protein